MTTPQTRLILSVPFTQKEQAKALGARWDKEGKVWWVPSSVDPTPFVRWVHLPQEKKPLYENLAVIDRDEVEEYGANGLLEVVFVPWTCWK